MNLIVDTNVGVVANQPINTDIPPNCVRKCISLLQTIQQGTHKLVLDDEWHIIREYQRQMDSSGQPGLGDAFLKWILTNYTNPKRCRLVTIHTKLNENGDEIFREFPNDDPELIGFDKSDHKFVAVALAHGKYPPIYNATDTDWRDYHEKLQKYSIQIEFLCSDLMNRERQ